MSMLIFKSIFLLLLCANSISSFALEQRTRTILIGVDGLFEYCFDKAETSGFKRIYENGSYTFNARSSIWAMSGPGWSNILCGLDTEDTGIVDNAWVPPYISRKYSEITPVTGLKPLPCVYEQLKKGNKLLKTKTSHAWDFLLYFGNEFIPEFIDEEQYCYPYDTLETTDACDAKTKDNTLRFIKEDFDFIFSYFGSVDETGHWEGFCSTRYIEQVSKVNSHINEILDELDKQGIAEKTYVILTTDHGASKNTTTHGAQTDDNLRIPWMIRGPGIKKKYEIKELVRNLITPQVILKVMKYEQNPLWRGKIPLEMFEDDFEVTEQINNDSLNLESLNDTKTNKFLANQLE